MIAFTIPQHEEIETTGITDTLVRFGANVTIASIMPSLTCKMSRNLQMTADVVSIEDASQSKYDLIVLPGGMPGAEHFRDSEALMGLLKEHVAAKKYYGAICAAPAVVLAHYDLLPGAATCYPAPGFRSRLKEVSEEKVVITDNFITSQGPATALEFGLTLGELLGKTRRNCQANVILARLLDSSQK